MILSCQGVLHQMTEWIVTLSWCWSRNALQHMQSTDWYFFMSVLIASTPVRHGVVPNLGPNQAPKLGDKFRGTPCIFCIWKIYIKAALQQPMAWSTDRFKNWMENQFICLLHCSKSGLHCRASDLENNYQSCAAATNGLIHRPIQNCTALQQPLAWSTDLFRIDRKPSCGCRLHCNKYVACTADLEMFNIFKATALQQPLAWSTDQFQVKKNLLWMLAALQQKFGLRCRPSDFEHMYDSLENIYQSCTAATNGLIHRPI